MRKERFQKEVGLLFNDDQIDAFALKEALERSLVDGVCLGEMGYEETLIYLKGYEESGDLLAILKESLLSDSNAGVMSHDSFNLVDGVINRNFKSPGYFPRESEDAVDFKD